MLRERSIEQNSRLHALLQDISTQKQWHGQHLDVECWKRLLVAAWERANGRSAEFYPALDGVGMDVVYTRTSRLNKGEMSELVEYATVWAIENNVELHDAPPPVSER